MHTVIYKAFLSYCVPKMLFISRKVFFGKL